MTMLIRTLILIAAMLAPLTVKAADFDWTKKADREKMHSAFGRLSQVCVTDYGFTRLPALPGEVSIGKIEAHLLLQESADVQLETWAAILRRARYGDDEATKNALAERGADALLAAAADPDSYSRAEGLYVTTLMSVINMRIAACSAIAADPFLGKHYFTGAGSGAAWEARAKEQFSKGVAEAKVDKAKL